VFPPTRRNLIAETHEVRRNDGKGPCGFERDTYLFNRRGPQSAPRTRPGYSSRNEAHGLRQKRAPIHCRSEFSRRITRSFISSSRRFARGRAIDNGLAGSVPILFLAGRVSLGCHHAGHRVRESVLHRAIRLLPRAHALEPIGHVSQRQVIDAHGRQFSFSGKRTYFAALDWSMSALSS
jgi:hypothetical protein